MAKLHVNPDTTPPTAVMNPLPELSETNPVTLSWSGSDDRAGIASYTLRYRMDEGPEALLAEVSGATTSLDLWVGQNTRYWFSVQATDRAGNPGAKSPAVGTTTAVPALDPSLADPLDDDPDLYDPLTETPCLPARDPKNLVAKLLLDNQLCGTPDVQVDWGPPHRSTGSCARVFLRRCSPRPPTRC